MKIIFKDDSDKELETLVIDAVDTEVLESNIADPVEWIINFINEKIRKRTDSIILKTGLGSKHTDPVKKKELVTKLSKQKHKILKPVKQKEKEIESNRNK